MARHRTVATPHERRRSVLRWAGRAASWLALGALVGLAAWGALTWAGSAATTARSVGLAAGVLAAAAAGVAASVPGPDGRDDRDDGPAAG